MAEFLYFLSGLLKCVYGYSLILLIWFEKHLPRTPFCVFPGSNSAWGE